MQKTDFNNMEELLQFISNLPTPKEFVELKNGVEYVKVEYLKYILNKFFRPWNWHILKSETMYINELPAYEKIVGRLEYTDPYTGNRQSLDVAAAHRIQYNKNNELIDPGNDTKAANTDAFKKACNMALNIADDIYRSQTKLTEEEVKELEEYLNEFDLKTKEDLYETVDRLIINKNNFKKELAGARFRRRNSQD